MEEIQGIVDSIIFKNEENNYVVARVKEDKNIITIVGCIPYITESQNLELTGRWIIHPKFGKQFKVEGYKEVIPNTTRGIERYLSSGIISGIGPVTAKKIVEKFAEDTLNVLENNSERLKEIEGIGDKRVALIYKSFIRQKELKDIVIFFQSYGVTVNQCMKIYKKFKENSIDVVKNNPYVLTEEIRGIGFKTADKIARKVGIEINSPFRIESGIKYVINEFCSLGNTYMPMELLIKECINVLLVDKKEVENNIVRLGIEGSIKVENVGKSQCVFNIPYYYCELGVTKKIITLAMCKYDELEINMDKEIQKFESTNDITFAKSQKEAIKGALCNGIEIITGGPGTGKTTIINSISHIFEKHGFKVFMGAPTGRAAKRMAEATGREAKTLHRLLEMGAGEEEGHMFSKSEESPLECDVIIIDEASMIDILLMNSLLKAISMGTRIVIVGDVDQLPSVGPGNVLRDLIESDCVKVVKLKDIFRQSSKSMITVNAHKINNGEMPMFNEKDKDFYFLNLQEENNILNTLIGLIGKRLPNYNKNWKPKRDIQILSPMRKGILGIENLNEKLQKVLNPPSNDKKEKNIRGKIFRSGDKIMQIKNNYMLKWRKIGGIGEEEGSGIFNGDIGYIEDIDEERNKVTIIFDEEKRVDYDDTSLDEIDLAYAVTIHKSQGSEFPVVVMPIYMGPPLLMNRNLLYTGITRAKKLVVLVGKIKALKFMISNNKSFDRYSLLKWRIRNILNNDAIDSINSNE